MIAKLRKKRGNQITQDSKPTPQAPTLQFPTSYSTSPPYSSSSSHSPAPNSAYSAPNSPSPHSSAGRSARP